MEDQDAENDGYSDDDLDALPDHAFHELQEDAVRSTQQPTTRASLLPLRQPLGPETVGIAGGLGRLSVGGAASQRVDQHNLPPPSSDYGDFDDEMLDGEVLDGEMFDVAEQPKLAQNYKAHAVERQSGVSTQREDWRQQRYGGPESNFGASVQPTRERKAAEVPFVNGVVSHGRINNVQTREPDLPESREPSVQAPKQTVDVEALQAQVQKVCSNKLYTAVRGL